MKNVFTLYIAIVQFILFFICCIGIEFRPYASPYLFNYFFLLATLFVLWVLGKNSEKVILLNPIFMFTMFVFLFPNVSVISLYGSQINLIGINSDILKNVVLYNYYVSLSFLVFFVCLYIRNLMHIKYKSKILNLKRNENVRMAFVYAIFLFALLAKFILYKLGVYGAYYNLIERVVENKFYISILQSVSVLSTSMIFVIFLLSEKNRNLNYILFTADLVLNWLSLFKGVFISGFLLYYIALKIRGESFSFVRKFVVLITLIIGFVSIEFFRLDIQRQTDGVIQLGNLISNYTSSSESSEFNYPILERFNYLESFIESRKYIETKNLDDNIFLSNTFFFPRLLIPRFLWSEKPENNLGTVWMNNEVFGNSDFTSLAFGPIGFLSLSGGSLGVVFGFLIIGVLMAWLNSLYQSNSIYDLLLLIIVSSVSFNLEGPFDFYVIRIFLVYFIAKFLLWFLFKGVKSQNFA